jgi:hypothetical protein
MSLPFAASAAPALTRINPNAGFSFGETVVRIEGTQLTPLHSIRCERFYPTLCAVKVKFGDTPGLVLSADPHVIRAIALPQPAGTKVDVTVTLENGTQLTRPKAFTFEDRPSSVTIENFRRYLVPLRTGELRGANGSRWLTELTVHNGTDDNVPQAVPVLASTCDSRFLTPPCSENYIDIPAGTSQSLELAFGYSEGSFLYVPEPLAGAVDLSMRARELTRDAEGWGTNAPIIPVATGFQRKIRLLDVPTDRRFRTLLRIYGETHAYEGSPMDLPMEVRVAVYPMSGTTAIESRDVVLPGLSYYVGAFPFEASSLALDPLTETVRSSGHERVRIEVEYFRPTRPNPPIDGSIWALLSITNNTTHQVTTILPHVH